MVSTASSIFEFNINLGGRNWHPSLWRRRVRRVRYSNTSFRFFKVISGREVQHGSQSSANSPSNVYSLIFRVFCESLSRQISGQQPGQTKQDSGKSQTKYAGNVSKHIVSGSTSPSSEFIIFCRFTTFIDVPHVMSSIPLSFVSLLSLPRPAFLSHTVLSHLPLQTARRHEKATSTSSFPVKSVGWNAWKFDVNFPSDKCWKFGKSSLSTEQL